MITRVIEALRSHPVAMIKFPNLEEITRYVEPSVRIVIGFIDGLSLPTQCSSDEDEQNAFYNGYYHDTAVNNILLFSPHYYHEGYVRIHRYYTGLLVK